jgi:DNA polymerase V
VAQYAPRQEVYSIDESFLDFDGVPATSSDRPRPPGQGPDETGLPTSVGFGPTKTLAKLANHIAKTADRKPGSYDGHLAQVCNLGACPKPTLQAFAATEVGSVWGVGRKIGARLVEGGVRTVLDLVRCDVATLRKQFSVVLEKTVLELRGTSCLSMDEAPAAKQQILVSRSFGKAVTDVAGIVEAVSEFASRAAESLRLQNGAAGAVNVFFTTSPFRQNDRQHSPSVTVPTGSAHFGFPTSWSARPSPPCTACFVPASTTSRPASCWWICSPQGNSRANSTSSPPSLTCLRRSHSETDRR